MAVFDSGEGDVQQFGAVGPEFRRRASEREVDREQSREEHHFAAEPHDGADSYRIRALDRSCRRGIGR